MSELLARNVLETCHEKCPVIIGKYLVSIPFSKEDTHQFLLGGLRDSPLSWFVESTWFWCSRPNFSGPPLWPGKTPRIKGLCLATDIVHILGFGEDIHLHIKDGSHAWPKYFLAFCQYVLRSFQVRPALNIPHLAPDSTESEFLDHAARWSGFHYYLMQRSWW